MSLLQRGHLRLHDRQSCRHFAHCSRCRRRGLDSRRNRVKIGPRHADAVRLLSAAATGQMNDAEPLQHQDSGDQAADCACAAADHSDVEARLRRVDDGRDVLPGSDTGGDGEQPNHAGGSTR